MSLKSPPDPQDEDNHREVKSRLAALRHKRLYARRWHHQCIVSLDALFAELMDTLPGLPIAERPAAIARAEAEMAPFRRPVEENKILD